MKLEHALYVLVGVALTALLLIVTIGAQSLFLEIVEFLAPSYMDTETTASAVTVPEDATEANVWIQAECETDGACGTMPVVVRSISVPGIISESFSGRHLRKSNIANDVEWSLELARSGCNDQLDDCATFVPPAQAFSYDNGLRFSIPPTFYAGMISCNITRDCVRPVEGGAELTPAAEICNASESDTVRARIGFDWFECRGSNCSDGDDDFISAEQTDWFTVSPLECLHVN